MKFSAEKTSGSHFSQLCYEVWEIFEQQYQVFLFALSHTSINVFFEPYLFDGITLYEKFDHNSLFPRVLVLYLCQRSQRHLTFACPILFVELLWLLYRLMLSARPAPGTSTPMFSGEGIKAYSCPSQDFANNFLFSFPHHGLVTGI